MNINVAEYDKYNEIIKFYHDLIDGMQNSKFNCGWIKNIYPSQNFIYDSITNNEVIIAEIDNNIVGVMIINHESTVGYEKVEWKTTGAKNEVLIIHAFGVSPNFQNQGIASKMLAYIIKKSKDSQIKAVRLDVLASNLPAQKLYTKIGFVFIDTMQLFYENTGTTDFLLYELIL